MKIALVTGAAGGLGKKICEVLVLRGFRIVALDLSKTEVVRESLKDIEGENENVKTINVFNSCCAARLRTRVNHRPPQS